MTDDEIAAIRERFSGLDGSRPDTLVYTILRLLDALTEARDEVARRKVEQSRYVVAAHEARKDGARDMRERAAVASARVLVDMPTATLGVSRAIRALPLTGDET